MIARSPLFSSVTKCSASCASKSGKPQGVFMDRLTSLFSKGKNGAIDGT